MKKSLLVIFTFFSVLIAFSQTFEITKSAQLEKTKLISDTTWVLDSTLHQRLIDDEFINTARSINLSFDIEGRVTSSITQNWNQLTNSYDNKYLDSTSFDPVTDFEVEYSNYQWDTTDYTWKLIKHEIWDRNGKPLIEIRKDWDPAKSSYSFGFRKRWIYTESGKLESYYWDAFNEETQDFVYQTKKTHYYNEFDQDTTTTLEKWNTNTEIWNKLSRSDFTYNQSGLVGTATIYDWSGLEENWKIETQTLFSYNSNEQPDTTTYLFWLEDKQLFYPSYRIVNDYDNDGHPLEIRRQDCLFPADNFINSMRLINIYQNDLLVEEREQEWIGNDEWRDKYIDVFTYVYDTLFESQTMIYYDKYTQSYDTSFRSFIVYDDRPLTIKSLMQNWSSDLSDFVTTSQRLYYWGALAAPDAINEKVDDLLFSVYPNPSGGIVHVQLLESQTTDSRIVVFDLSGRIVMEKLVSSENEQVDLSSQAKGTYFLQVISGNSRGIKQVIRY